MCPHPEKYLYSSKAEAKRALRDHRRWRNRDTMHAYRCGSHFHLGHKR